MPSRRLPLPKPVNLAQIAGPHARRPKYKPTPADRATVQNLAALGACHEDIARCLGDHGIDDKTMRKHFREELDTSLIKVKALAMSKVVAGMNAGEAWAVCFFLKCRAGWREGHIIAGDPTAPLEVNVSGLELLNSRISRIAARRGESGSVSGTD
jgi:hypothetical protein